MTFTIPTVNPGMIAKARAVWEQMIDAQGRTVSLTDTTGTLSKDIKAFVKRPKILGLFDRTEQSYDQEKYMLLVKAVDFPTGYEPAKFFRATWDGEDHIFISTTAVDLAGDTFGYRILVKG